MLLFDGEGFADNALCKPFEILFLVRLYARAAMNTDAGVLPAQQHLGVFGR